MKPLDTDPEWFGLMPMLDAFARKHGLSISDSDTQDKFLEAVRSKLRSHCQNPAMLHGFHVQSMFAYVVAALGRCALVREADSGAMVEAPVGLRRPDFRLVSSGGDQMLVEVKNHYHKSFRKPYSLSVPYLRSLQQYASLMGLPLKLAVYWARWGIWTLVDAKHLDLPLPPEKVRMALSDALMLNELGDLGDYMVSTVPPLEFRVHADPALPRAVQPDGTASIAIGAVQLLAAGNEICSDFEKRLAFFFMNYGSWRCDDAPAQVVNGDVEHFGFLFEPVEPDEDQSFSSLGYMSSMIARQYKDATSNSGTIHVLAPHSGPDEMGFKIPDDFHGDVMGLWRFQVHPNVEGYRRRRSPSG